MESYGVGVGTLICVFIGSDVISDVDANTMFGGRGLEVIPEECVVGDADCRSVDLGTKPGFRYPEKR